MKITKALKLFGVCLLLLNATGCGMLATNPFYIEYDEEVKLHTGEMIVVHMKRKYARDSWEGLWNPKPKFAWRLETEISWDTGFPGVGKKTLKFDETIGIIEQFEGGWFIVGTWDLGLGPVPVGYYYNGNAFAWVNEKGSLRTIDQAALDRFFAIHPKANILYFTTIPYEYEDKLLTWQQKLAYDVGPNGMRVLRPKK